MKIGQVAKQARPVRARGLKELWPAVVAGFVAFLLIPSCSQAELLEAELTVAGMACPFCAFGIEKKLRAVDGVQEVTVFLDDGVIQLVFSPANGATAGEVQHAVEEAGFRLSNFSLKVRGRLIRVSNEISLDAGAKARFKLLEARAGETGPVSAETGEAMEKASKGRSLVVHGAVRAQSTEVPELVVEAYEEDSVSAP